MTDALADTCGQGHPWDEHVVWRPGRGYVCRGCERERVRRYRARIRAGLIPVPPSMRSRRPPPPESLDEFGDPDEGERPG